MMMKKKIALLSLLVLSVLGVQTTFAQTAPSTTTSPKSDRAARPMPDPQTRATRQSKRLTQALKLDEATAQKVYEASLARTQKVDQIRTSTSSDQDKIAALKANHQEFEGKLKSILSEDQYSQYLTLKKQMKHHGHKGKKGHKADSADSKSSR